MMAAPNVCSATDSFGVPARTQPVRERCLSVRASRRRWNVRSSEAICSLVRLNYREVLFHYFFHVCWGMPDADEARPTAHACAALYCCNQPEHFKVVEVLAVPARAPAGLSELAGRLAVFLVYFTRSEERVVLLCAARCQPGVLALVYCEVCHGKEHELLVVGKRGNRLECHLGVSQVARLLHFLVRYPFHPAVIRYFA